MSDFDHAHASTESVDRLLMRTYIGFRAGTVLSRDTTLQYEEKMR